MSKICNKIQREELVKLDQELEMIPLTFDKQFKKVFEGNLEILKRFLIITLKLPIKEDECNITIDEKEQIKYNHKEYQMTYDISVVLNGKTNIMVEMNSKYFKEIKERNSLYLDRKRLSLVEEGKDPNDYSDTYVYQLNLNPKEKRVRQGEHIIVPYDLVANSVFIDNKIMVLKYLEYYRKLYYTYSNREEEVIWLAGLTSKTFTELYDIYSQILTPKELEKLIEDVIKMSKDHVTVHEWEQEKMKALVEYCSEKERRENPEEYAREIEELGEEIKGWQKREEERQKHKLKRAEEQGMEKGMEKGTYNGKIETAKNMLNLNLDIDIIVKATNLSKEEIENLK